MKRGRAKIEHLPIHKQTLLQYAAEVSIQFGQSPLEFLLSLMRNEKVTLALRLEAAKAAAPYIHPKLAQIRHVHQEGTLEDHQIVFLGGVLAGETSDSVVEMNKLDS